MYIYFYTARQRVHETTRMVECISFFYISAQNMAAFVSTCCITVAATFVVAVDATTRRINRSVSSLFSFCIFILYKKKTCYCRLCYCVLWFRQLSLMAIGFPYSIAFYTHIFNTELHFRPTVLCSRLVFSSRSLFFPHFC